MATKAFGLPEDHYRSVTVTTLTALFGVAAALVSSLVTAGAGSPAAAANSSTALYVLVAFVLLQFPLYTLLGIDVDDFSAKDYLYVAFMTFSVWFVVWTILLTSGTVISA